MCKWSLATRLAIWYAASAFLLLVGATGFLYWVVVHNFDRQDDAHIKQKLREAEELLMARSPSTTTPSVRLRERSGADDEMATLVRVLDDEGRIVMESPGMSEWLPASSFAALAPGEWGWHVYTEAGHPFRAMVMDLMVGDDRPRQYRVQVAVDHGPVHALLAHYRNRIAGTLGLGLVLCALAGYYITRRELSPIKRMAAAIRSIRSTTLNQRIAAEEFPAELSTLAEAFNQMLQRLEDAFARLLRYSADIAHELRSPIHNLRGEAEVALSRTRTPQEYREVLGSCLEECVRLSSLIDSMLFLARAENPERQIRREPLRIARELATLREFYAAHAAEAGISLQLEAGEELAAGLDRHLFQRAVGNLIENAIAYSNPGGQVTLGAYADGSVLRVEVADTGRGIPPEHLPHVFDRFYRVDATRSKKTGGLGLGLAIVKTIANLHGGDVRISSEVGVGTRITLLLPIVSATGVVSGKEPFSRANALAV